MIYLDNAATTLHKPKEVQEAVIAAFGQMGNSGRGASEPALKALGTVYDAREALARLFHAENASEIVFTANSTEALNIAIKGILDPGDHVITTVLEHNSVLRPLYECRRKGVEMTLHATNMLTFHMKRWKRQSEKIHGRSYVLMRQI